MYESKGHRPAKPAGTANRVFNKFRREESGATAIEFGIVAAPFFALMIAIMEVALVYFANFSLENGVDRAARLIRTGQAQEQGFSQSQFKQAVCENVSVISGCLEGLKIEVVRYDNFGGVAPSDPLDGDGQLRDDFGYDPGTGGDVVLVRAFYEWSLVAAIPGGLGNMPSGGRLISAVAAFRNEPFDQ